MASTPFSRPSGHGSRSLVAVALVLAATLVASLASARTLELEYDASSGFLPSAAGWTHVLEDPLPDDGLDESNFSVAGGVLTQGDTGGPNGDVANRQYYETTDYDYHPDLDTIEIEFRVRITPGSSWTPPSMADPNPGAAFGVDVADLENERILFWLGAGGLYVWAGFEQALHLFDPTASMMDYVLRIDALGVGISVNGTPVGFVPRSTFGPYPTPRLRFGDYSLKARGGFEMEYFRVWRSDPIAAEVRGYEVVSSTNPALGSPDALTQTASCPAGKVALGGGAEIVGGLDRAILTESRLSGGSPPTSWTASAERKAPGLNWTLRADVVCGEMPKETERSGTALNAGSGAVSSTRCLGNQSPISGGAALAIIQGDQPALTAIGIDVNDPTRSQAEAYDLDYQGVPEGHAYELTATVACVDSHDQVIVSRSMPVGDHDAVSPKTYDVTCPGNFEVVGGGARVIGDSTSAVLGGSHPNRAMRSWNAVGYDLNLIYETRDDWGLEVTAVCVPPADPMLPRRGIVSRWHGDDGDASDSIGSNDANLVNGASVEPAIFDQAFELEASGQEHLRVIAGDTFYPSGSFSADAWFQTNSFTPGVQADIVNLFDPAGIDPPFNQSYWALHLSIDGEARGRVRSATSTTTPATAVAGTGNLADGALHHIAMVRDLEGGFELRLYVDGVEVDTEPLGQGGLPLYPGNAALPDPLTIGVQREALTGNVIRPFDGFIDDVKYWDRALTGEEVARMAGCGLSMLPRVVNLDASRFGGPAGSDDQLKLCVWLDAGTYTLQLGNPATNPEAIHTAWLADGASTDAWRTDFRIEPEIDPGFSGGDSTPRSTAEDAFDQTSPVYWELTLSAPQRVYLGVEDDAVLDNGGGVSLVIYAPEPAGGALLAFGALSLAALHGRRRV